MPPGCMRDYDALVRALGLYDLAREAFADRPTEGNAAIMRAEHDFLAIRAIQCGHGGGDDLHAWAKKRVSTYRNMISGGAAELAAATMFGVLGGRA